MAENDEKSVVIDVRADSEHLQSDLNAAARTVKKSSEEMAQSQTKADDEVAKKHKQNAEEKQKHTENLEKKEKEANQNVKEDSSKTGDAIVKKHGEDSEKLKKQTEGVERHAKETDDSIEKHAKDTGNDVVKKHGEDVEKLKKQTDDYKEKAISAAKDVGKAAAGIGTALAGASAAAIVSAAKDETSFAKVKTLLSPDTNPQAYADAIKAAVRETGVSFTALSESVYSAISASVDEQSAVTFTADAVKLAKGGFTDTATSVDVLTTSINAYSLSAKDASHVSDVLITAQNEGKTTVNELASSMGQTIPIANSAGAAIEDLAAQYAVLTKNGVATAEAGTGIKAMLSELNSAGSNVSKILKGITGKSFAELQADGKGTADILNILGDYAASSGQKLSDLFGSVEAGSAALTIVKDGGEDFNRILSKMENSAGATEKAYQTMANTTEERFEKLKNRFILGVSEIGEKILPYVEDFFDYVDEHSDEFESAIEDAGKLLLEFSKTLGEVVKIGWEFRDVLLIAGAAIGGWKLGQAVSSVVSLTTAIGGASGAMTALNAVFAANPIGLIVTAAAAGVAGLALLSNEIGNTEKITQRALEKVKSLTDQVNDFNREADNSRTSIKSLQGLIDQYREIAQSVDDDAEKKTRLIAIQEELNGLYEDEAAQIDLVNGKYEENIERLEALSETKLAYLRAQAAENVKDSEEAVRIATGLIANGMSKYNDAWTFDYKADKGEAVSDGTLAMREILEDVAKKYGIGEISTTRDGNGGTITVDFSGIEDFDLQTQSDVINDIITQMSELGLEDEFYKNYTALYELWESKTDVIQTNIDAQEQYNRLCGDTAESLSEEAESEKKAASAAEKLSGSTDGVTESFNEERISIDDLIASNDELVATYQELYELLGKVQSGEALTYEEIQKLIGIYPALAEHISLTSDGYVIEKNVIDDLNAALDDSVEAQIDAEREKTLAAVHGARERIALYQKEAEALQMYMASKGGGTAEEQERARALSAAISDESDYIDELYAQLKLNIGDYLKNGAKSDNAAVSEGTSSQKGTTKKNEAEENAEEFSKKKKELDYQLSMGEIDKDTYYKNLGDYRDEYLVKDSDAWRSANISIHSYEESKKDGRTETEKNADEYKKKKKDLDYQRDMGEITDAEYYHTLGSYRDTYLEKDSDEWRSANVDIHKYEKSQKEAAEKDTKKSSGKGTVISIDSYIPTLWDDEEESNRKLQEALGIELAGNSQTGKRFSIESPDSFADATSLSPSTSAVTVSQSTSEATLSDVLKELKELKETDTKRKISLDVDLYARDLMIGRVSIEDINDIAKQTGKSPFSFMQKGG